MLVPHKIWASSLFAAGTEQKRMRVCQDGAPTDVLLTLLNSAPGTTDGQPNSQAEPSGWSVQVAFAASPDTVLFNRPFVNESEARGAYKDLVSATAEVEGLLRQEKMEEATAATAKLFVKYGANSTNPPADIEE